MSIPEDQVSKLLVHGRTDQLDVEERWCGLIRLCVLDELLALFDHVLLQPKVVSGIAGFISWLFLTKKSQLTTR